MKTRILVALLLVFLASISHAGKEEVKYKKMLKSNNSNLQQLSAGMTKQQVMQTMGQFYSEVHDGTVTNPAKTRTIQIGNDNFEVLLYMTRKYPPFTPLQESQGTPVIFKNGSLVGLGWEDYKKIGYNSVIPAKLYNLENGEVLIGGFTWRGYSGGAAITKPNGAECSGEYRTEQAGQEMHGWGKIYTDINLRGPSTSQGYGSTNSQSNGSTNSQYSGSTNSYYSGGSTSEVNTSVSISPNSFKGSSIASCSDRTAIQCEYIVNKDNHGSGYCRGSEGTEYKLVF